MAFSWKVGGSVKSGLVQRTPPCIPEVNVPFPATQESRGGHIEEIDFEEAGIGVDRQVQKRTARLAHPARSAVSRLIEHLSHG
jgi:hypothetical protein